MIASKYRFHGHGSLRYVHKNGHSERSHWFMMRYVSNPTRRFPRFAVIVSKKVYKSAVKRNRIRRRIYESLRAHITATSPAIDIAITVYAPEVLSASFADIEQQIEQLLRAADFIKPTKDDKMKSPKENHNAIKSI
jgi:ribonuclease P protein component